MWKTFAKFGRYFYNILMPARFRRAAMERGATRYLERGVDKWQRPDQLAEMAADDAARAAAKKEQQRSAAEGAREETQAGTGQAQVAPPPATFASRVLLVLRWILHFLLVALVLIGLYYLNRWL